ncbi:ankyrin [Auriculariales sp. MPI-PUGE-AT-0066]|nr:ankyrin [Auriculariales sp. MPI-PUGE-AT-0066]
MAEKDLGYRLRRAVKENNLAHVKRLVQRVDMRNPDPGSSRYTSLAWAAVCGSEDTFDYLLASGHDDEELSKDAENNTILLLLAGVGPNSGYRPSTVDIDIREASRRMASRYYERYPFILDWSNLQGKTALHVAAVKGNEDFVRMLCEVGADFDMTDAQGNAPLHYASAWGHVQIIQLLIERGCQFAAKNTEGFAALDYAYSMATWDTLQDTARAHYEQKKAIRRNVYNQAAQRGTERSKQAIPYLEQPSILPSPSDFRTDKSERSRSSSDRLDDRQPAMISSASLPQVGGRATQTKVPLQQVFSQLSSSNAQRSHPYLSQVGNRMREKDADAMAEYMKRSRSGSNGSTAPTSHVALGYSTASSVAAEQAKAVASNHGRTLRPSMSAASLRVMSTLSSSPPEPEPAAAPTQSP